MITLKRGDRWYQTSITLEDLDDNAKKYKINSFLYSEWVFPHRSIPVS